MNPPGHPVLIPTLILDIFSERSEPKENENDEVGRVCFLSMKLHPEFVYYAENAILQQKKLQGIKFLKAFSGHTTKNKTFGFLLFTGHCILHKFDKILTRKKALAEP